MNTRILILFTTMAFLGFSGSATAHRCQGPEDTHKHCGDGPGPETDVPAEYSVKLALGDFVFVDDKSVVTELNKLTTNRKGTSLPGNQMLKMDPMVSDSQGVWDAIFYDCTLVIGGYIDGFDVQANKWSVNYTKERGTAGNVYLEMRDLQIYPLPTVEYSNVDFDFDLHGAVAPGETFLPEEIDNSIVHVLTEYKLWAGMGGQGGFTCNSDGRPALENNSYLQITRTK